MSNQTSLHFTDNVTTLKLCKVWNDNSTPPASFPFSFGVTGPAGPNGPTAPISLWRPERECTIVGQYRAGTVVTITEGVVPGTKASAIVASGAGSIVPGSLSIPDRTVTISMAGNAAGGVTEVDYTDVPAAPGWLKICKLAATPPPVGTLFVFTVVGSTKSVTVPVGQCVNLPGTFPYNSTVTIVETPSTGNAVSAIGVAPTFVTQDGDAYDPSCARRNSEPRDRDRSGRDRGGHDDRGHVHGHRSAGCRCPADQRR